MQTGFGKDDRITELSHGLLRQSVPIESLDDPLQGPLPSHDEFWTRVVRLQFRF